MTALMFLIGAIIVGGVAAFAYMKAHSEAEDARDKAALAADYNYRACLDRNDVKAVLSTLVEARLASGQSLDPIERAVFVDSLEQLVPSDCLSIKNEGER